jgi:hypothetical protein
MADLDAAAQKLKAACDNAYDSNASSCSNAVWDVVKAIVNPDEPYRQANKLIDYLSVNWTEVDLDKSYELANTGVVVVGGAKASPNGHVIVVYPGDKKGNGGYNYFWKKGNKNMILKATGIYPRGMSTSMGSWPGAKSRGDKTVWDPWGSDDAFDDVQFWTPKTNGQT